jgi:hypothetical protein
MPWVREGDGLRQEGASDYDVDEVRELIARLRQARNLPGRVCSQLDDLLATREAPKDLIWRLSKWCDWNDESAEIARAIAARLFHGNVCPRLRDQQDRPLPDRDVAEATYEAWRHAVVRAAPEVS